MLVLMGRSISLRFGAASLVLLVLPGCIFFDFDIRPLVLRDPAWQATGPERFLGDSYDEKSITTLRRAGANFPTDWRDASEDLAVVREALRVAPPTWARKHDVSHRDALTMILRRRPRAAYLVLTERMALADDEDRAGAACMFGDLDGRRLGLVPADHMPPWTGPEREAALARMEALALADPAPAVRLAAADAFTRGIAGPRRPTWHAVLAAVQREQDPRVYEDLLRLLATREAPAADRIEAAVRYTRDWFRAHDLLDGLVIEENRLLLESAFRRAPFHFKQALFKEADYDATYAEEPQPWLEGIVLLALNDADKDVREEGAYLSRYLGTPSPAVLTRLRALRATSPWAAQALKELEAVEQPPR